MAKIKDTPNLPGSSRMQMPSTGGSMGKAITEYGGLKSSKGGSTTSKVMSAAKAGKSMKGSNPYC